MSRLDEFIAQENVQANPASGPMPAPVTFDSPEGNTPVTQQVPTQGSPVSTPPQPANAPANDAQRLGALEKQMESVVKAFASLPQVLAQVMGGQAPAALAQALGGQPAGTQPADGQEPVPAGPGSLPAMPNPAGENNAWLETARFLMSVGKELGIIGRPPQAPQQANGQEQFMNQFMGAVDLMNQFEKTIYERMRSMASLTRAFNDEQSQSKRIANGELPPIPPGATVGVAGAVRAAAVQAMDRQGAKAKKGIKR